MKNYQPRPGSLAERVVAYLRQHGGTVKAREMAELFGAKNIANNLANAIEHGAIVRIGNAASTCYGLPGDESDASAQQRAVGSDDARPELDDGHPLEIVMYGDGDVAIKGHAVSEHDADTAVFTSTQLEFLVRRLTRPFVQVGT